METQPVTTEQSIPSTSGKAAPAWRVWQPLIALGFAVGGVALAVRGQQVFNQRNEALLLNGMLYFAGGVLLFLFATVLASPVPFRWQRARPEDVSETRGTEEETEAWWNRLPLWRFLLGFSAVVLMGGVLNILAQVPRVPSLADYSGLVWRWLAAIVLMAAAFLQFDSPERIRAAAARAFALLRTHRLEAGVMAGILLVSGVLRLWALGDIPSHLNGDEASIGMDVQRILAGEIRDPFGLMWGPLPSLSGFVIAGFYQWFGGDIFALRLPGALAGTLGVVGLYALARGFVRRDVALGAALLLATLPIHIHYSRIAVNVAWDTFFYPSTLGALYWAIARTRPESSAATGLLALTGLLAGFAQYAYSGSRLLPVIVLGVVGIYVLFAPHRLRGKWLALAGMAAVFVTVASPLYLHALRYPDDFNARLNQTGIFQTGFVEQEKAARNTDTVGVLTEQLRRTVFGFAFINDTTETWGSETPLVPTLFSLALFLGLILSLRRWREPSTALLHGWFWSVIILGGALTTNPPTSNRLISAMPVVALFAAMGWDWVAQAFTPESGYPVFRRRAHQVMLAIFLVGTAAVGIYSYQGYLQNNNYGGLNAKVATFIGRDLAQRPAGTTLVSLTAPRIFSGMSPIVFQAPGFVRKDYNDLVQSIPPDLPPGDLLIVALPERLGELGSFQQEFGGAPPTEVRDPKTNQVLYYSLWIDR